ncbi:hypothetical protein [Deinococcus soli (ex Cha et al. 2016)]|uniref:Uncharacterized protein n=2 Tax=Deinococcus soli (ex Cha et al. 2016) TaxID=1309411 RepID=A0AAE3XGN5_9DEIO|nr:hypothetical protein [Deinococcus soli (ex Cha et al. 2016)]MDR6220544.1 hypothetical protein [Deinococcus soli (ex Cha et al. 2016)]MDR6330370.1 hypothetical protein [Deinococcus soli (ex Cha et al. 2016)]MDR6753212.1 hypothetical protein [Deinococcus soli (ex Cha et al. 2016)]
MAELLNVLNIPVDAAMLAAWRGWLAPARPPFYLTAAEADALGLDTVPRDGLTLTPEARDTITEWNIPPLADRVAWLTLADVDALPPGSRRALLRAQVRHGRGNVPLGRAFPELGLPPGRFLWRPGQLTAGVLARLVAASGVPCQRAEVPPEVWRAAQEVLPGARALVGSFPQGSAGNCFGTVMGAAGTRGAAAEWMQREPFEAFLHEHTRPGGRDDQAGTVLLWRSASGLAQHAAVTLGSGWALHKAAQTWWTPRVVLPVPTLIRASRSVGWRLSRRQLR